MELCELVVDGDQLPAGIKAGIKKSLAAFVGVVRKLRRAADKVSAVIAKRQAANRLGFIGCRVDTNGHREDGIRGVSANFSARLGLQMGEHTGTGQCLAS